MKRRTLLTGSLVACSGVALGGVLLARHGHDDLVTVTGPTMGTHYRLRVPAYSLPPKVLRETAEEVLDGVVARMSTYRSESELSLFNHQSTADWTITSEQTLAVIAKGLEVSRLTEGAFDPTVGPLVELWGFGPSGSIATPPDERALADIARRVGFRHLHVSSADGAVRKMEPTLDLDLSGIAKGFAVDRLATALNEAGVERYLIDVGGELRAKGRKPGGDAWRVGIERPVAGAQRIHRVVALEDGAIATSGDYRNFFVHAGRRYTHAIDPRTSYPVAHALASVSVVTDDAMSADALSTALMVMGPEEGYDFARRLDLAAFFIMREGVGHRELATPAFAAYRIA